MSDTGLGFVLRVSQYRVAIHYTDCCWYRRARRRDLPLARTVRFVPCRKCRPSEADIRAAIPELADTVRWYAFSHTPGGAIRVVPWFEGVENVAARRALGWGRTLPCREGWS